MFRTLFAAATAALCLSGCVIIATDDGAEMNFADGKSAHAAEHYDTASSTKSFDTTLADLRGAIDRRGLKTFAVIDHAAGAASAGTSLPPTTLIIFGSPQAGSPMISNNRWAGIELPMRAMVWQKEDGSVKVAITRIKHVAKITDYHDNTAIARIDGTLEGVLTEATQ